MNRRTLIIPALLLALAGCGGGHTDNKPTPSDAQAAYDAGYTDASDALTKGQSIPVMAGMEQAALQQCESIVAAFNSEKTLPPGFNKPQKENWYIGCEDAIQGNDRNNGHATRTPAGPA